MNRLSLRQHDILNYVVETHIETALPVGSKTVTERYGVNCSPATVRHEMGELEDRGYLRHPYTSSGRIPTDQGYRYYVDRCLQVRRTLADVAESLQPLWEEADRPESFMEESARVLASLAREVSLIHWSGRVYLHGASHLFEKPEFQDLEKIRDLFHAFEEKDELTQWITSRAADQGAAIFIGHENRPKVLKDCGVVSAQYASQEDHGKVITIAIVGPVRMRYSETIPLATRMANAVGYAFREKWS